eukprot:483640_1
MSQLICFESQQGEDLMTEILSETSNDKKYIQPNLIASHCIQKTHSTCGVVSCLMLLNARLRTLNINPISEYQLLMHPYLVKATNNQISNIFKSGLTLKQVSNILDTFKCDTKMNICRFKNDLNEINIFRNICKNTFKYHNSTKGIIVNYLMSGIGQPDNIGHHSVIAAYNENTDRVLLLDCWIESKPNKLWVNVKDIYNAMATIDNDAKDYRGYIVTNVNVDSLVNKTSKL